MFNENEIEIAKIINDFLPEKLFDAHMHISHFEKSSGEDTFDKYCEYMRLFCKGKTLRCNGIVFPEKELENPAQTDKSLEFIANQLDKYPDNRGEIMVFPSDTVEKIEKRLIHKGIRGLKCYHIYADRKDTANANIEEYLPESAWQVANKKRMAITLHLVKNEALSHPDNLNYILNMSKKYPDAVLILAHAARAFAAWTVFDVVDKLKNCENVWFDFSAICEPTAMLYIIKKIGTSRCMWGTDYPICTIEGKAISIADTFYWIDSENLKQFSSKSNLKGWHVITEELMAMRQTCILADLTNTQKEDIFYNNADRLFCK